MDLSIAPLLMSGWARMVHGMIDERGHCQNGHAELWRSLQGHLMRAGQLPQVASVHAIATCLVGNDIIAEKGSSALMCQSPAELCLQSGSRIRMA